MRTRDVRETGYAVILLMLLGWPGSGVAGPPQTAESRIEAALTNIMTLERPGKDAYATVWDGNKYVQCQRMPDHALRCEAAGARMQPSLSHVLDPERVARLLALGWHLDPSFGNYVQTFAADQRGNLIVRAIVQTLAEGYDADFTKLEVLTDWIASERCPPRHGPTQSRAGMISDSMASTAVHACSYEAAAPPPPVLSARDLIDTYGTRVTGELQRLKVNIARWNFVALGTGAGYIQCESDKAINAISCEAQSADSRPELARILTPERIAHLHAAGFNDPGRAQNYWKIYPVDEFNEAAIANKFLTILHDVYGYTGSPKLEIVTENDD